MTAESQTKWTKGPWLVERKTFFVAVRSEAPIYPVRTGRGAHTICHINIADDEIALATGHLIAAAPALYEALEDIKACLCDAELCGHFTAEEIRTVIKAALALARGEQP